MRAQSTNPIRIEDQQQDQKLREPSSENEATSPQLEDLKEPLREFYDEATAGTIYQKVIINDYPMLNKEQKLKVPYIERFNGNLCVASADFEGAIKHYSKALLGMQHLFKMDEDPVITTQE